jgi:hypothetical protein
LYDAIKHGFTAIEVDVCAFEGVVKVAHICSFLSSKPDIEALYLKPLDSLIQKNGGTVYQNDSTPLNLYLDFKSSTAELCPLIKPILLSYQHLFSIRTETDSIWGPVRLLCDCKDIEIQQFTRWNGGVDQIRSPIPSWKLPRLGSNYNKHFNFRGVGKPSTEEQEKLKNMVDLANQHGRELRFWAASNKRKVWRFLLDHGVHVINVDKLARFEKFYWNYLKEKRDS